MTTDTEQSDGTVPSDESLAFDISSSDATAHVRLTGAVVESTVIELSNVLGGLVRGGHRRVTVDFGQLRQTSCVATGVLNRTAADLRAAHGELTLVKVPEETLALLRRAGLSRDVVVNPPGDAS
jgi:anti-anti-sigma regulatory factor